MGVENVELKVWPWDQRTLIWGPEIDQHSPGANRFRGFMSTVLVKPRGSLQSRHYSQFTVAREFRQII